MGRLNASLRRLYAPLRCDAKVVDRSMASWSIGDSATLFGHSIAPVRTVHDSVIHAPLVTALSESQPDAAHPDGGATTMRTTVCRVRYGLRVAVRVASKPSDAAREAAATDPIVQKYIGDNITHEFLRVEWLDPRNGYALKDESVYHSSELWVPSDPAPAHDAATWAFLPVGRVTGRAYVLPPHNATPASSASSSATTTAFASATRAPASASAPRRSASAPRTAATAAARSAESGPADSDDLSASPANGEAKLTAADWSAAAEAARGAFSGGGGGGAAPAIAPLPTAVRRAVEDDLQRRDSCAQWAPPPEGHMRVQILPLTHVWL